MAGDEPPLQPLVVPAASIPNPDQPPPPTAGQPVSPVQPIVPNQQTPLQAPAIIGSAPADYSGDFSKDYFTGLYKRLGLTRYEPTPGAGERVAPLSDRPDMWSESLNTAPGSGQGLAGERISGPQDLDFWLRPYSPGMRGASLSRALREGFDDTIIGAAVTAFIEVHKAVNSVVEPGYDPFRDRQITDAGMGNQMSLFYGSQGREYTRWLIDHAKEKQREMEWASHNGIVEQIGSFVGGLLGDPANVLPGNLGMKGVGILNRARQALTSGAELKLISAPSAIYGGIADGLRGMGVQAGVMIAERSIAHQLDPTIPGDVSNDIILPSALAGSLGILKGISSRFTARDLALRVRDPNFLRPTEPAVEPRRGPLGQVLEKIPEPLKDKVKEGAEDILAEQLQGEAPPPTPGPQPTPKAGAGKAAKAGAISPSNNGGFTPGALATDYGPMRAREHALNRNAVGFSEMVESSKYGKLANETKLVDAEGHPTPFYHGTRQVFSEFDPARSGERFGTSAKGGLIHFISDPATASQYAEARAKSEAVGSETVGAPNIHKVYLNMKNPIDIGPLLSQEIQAHPDFRMPTGLDDEAAHANILRIKNEIMPDIVAFVKAQGHDGMVAQTATNQGYEAIVFDKSQIVSMGERYEPKPVAPITANNHWLDETGKPQRLVDMEFKPGELPAAGATETHDASGRPWTTHGFDHRGQDSITVDGERIRIDQVARDYERVDDNGVMWKADTRDGLWRYVSDNPKPQTAEEIARVGRRGFLDETPTAEGAHQPGSIGAQLSPESLAYQESVLLAQGRLMPTGIGLERMPLNPLMRLFQGASVAAMRFAADIASTGGLITRANAEGIANLPPVEVMFQMRWNKRLVDTLRYQQDQWSAYRKKVAGVAEVAPEDVNIDQRSDWKRTSEMIGSGLKDKIAPGERGLSFEQFRIRVAEAQNKMDADEVSDAATPYVNASARKFRSDIYDHVKQRSIETGVFDEVHAAAVDQAQSDIKAIKKEADEVKRRSAFERWDPARTRQAEEALLVRMEDAEFKYRQQKEQLDRLRDNGPMLNGTALSYRPRLWDTGELLDNEEKFFDKVVPWFMSKPGGGLDQLEAVRITKQIHELLSHQNPVFDRGDMKALFQSVGGPTSAHARSFTIPDELVKDFLVNDSETLARYHVQQMGKAIEFKERFGSLDAKEQIAEIEQDYRRQIIEANRGATEPTELAKKLTDQMKTAIYDAQALRDKFYGTYGASPDPHRWDSRTIRMAKQFNNLTMLGMSGISALGDLIRPVMTEGLDAVYGYELRTLMSNARATIMRMNKQEMELTGNGMELALNVRAMAAADTGDVFGSRGRFEHGLNQANAWSFVANGLNGVNQIDKEMAHLAVSGRVNKMLLGMVGDAKVVPSLAHLSDVELKDVISKAEARIARLPPDSAEAQALRTDVVAHQQQLDAIEQGTAGAARIDELDRGRFAAAGIDDNMARRIGLQLKIHGVPFENIHMANTGAWKDDYARDVYRSAMNQFVNRTVPTPGIGDRPNWVSTETGSLIGQYKSFGMGALIRGALSGLQEGGNRFWYGAAAMVGFAIILNELKSQLFYDKSTFDKPAPAVIMDGIDRSGILGWFTDVNRAGEVLSGHTMGIKPWMGAEQPHNPTMAQVAGTIGGPTAGQAARVVSIANDYLSGHPTAQTVRNWRALTPGGTNPLLDKPLDLIYGTGDTPRRRQGASP